MFGDGKNGTPRSDNQGAPDPRWGKPDAPLTAKQRVFIEEYLKDGNATRAAVAAGYSPKRGRETGCELLRDPRIAAIVLARADELAGNLQATRIEVQAAQHENNTAAEAAADQIAVELHGLSGKARALMTLAESTGDVRTALQGLREISRLLELKAKLAGRIAGAKVEINLNQLNVELLSDADLEAFLNRAKDRVERIRARELDELIPPEQVERIQRSLVTQLLARELGCYVQFEEVVEIVRAAKAEDIERIKRDREVSGNLTSAVPIPPVVPQIEAPAVSAGPGAGMGDSRPLTPVVDIRTRVLAQLDDRRRY